MRITPFLLIFCISAPLFAAPLPPALTQPAPEVIAAAKSTLATMKELERGPYSRIRWFCSDGTDHPPTPYPCAARGGGVQHAAYSADREHLARLGWPAGTVIAALTWEQFWDQENRHTRLRALPLERYLTAIDDGWVLRRARNYRGRVQIEDEERAGRQLLLRLLAQKDFVRENLFLIRELVRTLPHGQGGEDRTRTIRHLSQEIAEAVPAFTPLRVEIHTMPSAKSAERVRGWLQQNPKAPQKEREKGERLAQALDGLYGEEGRRDRLRLIAKKVEKSTPPITVLLQQEGSRPPLARIALLTEVIEQLGQHNLGSRTAQDLLRLDLLQELEAEIRTSALELLQQNLTRQELLQLAQQLLRGCRGVGLLSATEEEALAQPLSLLATDIGKTAEYATATRRLSLVASWSALTVRYHFAEPLSRYAAVEPKAQYFVDDLLRDSLLLPLAEVSKRLAADGAQVAGMSHRLFGKEVVGLLGINPGVASGTLRLLERTEEMVEKPLASDEIVVMSETVAELTPVAGILTLGEGNPLSHVQMLARNLGIPNSALSPALLPQLRDHAGKRVVLAVASDGRVVLEEVAEASSLSQQQANREGRQSRVEAPRPDLSVTQPLYLSQLNTALSGKVVGPKAANVGELHRIFPGRIAPAIALPFGIFAAHTEAPRLRLLRAFQRN
ncbi:MAG: hypothetical protein HQL48_12015, partial [Gammaproteobacteria bacterium]|nr:hypothetical protein [Gammaproteobacteria bacterium]